MVRIKIQENEEIKLSQYADDTDVLLADVQSVSNLYDLLSLFERCSGVKINRAKSEMLWLGSMRNSKDTILDLQITSEPVYALGVHFTYDRQSSDRNFFLRSWVFNENIKYVVAKRYLYLW